jgi:hypothetical protein
MVSNRCKSLLVSELSVVRASPVGEGGGAQAASPARSAMCAAVRGGITAPLDVQNAAADVWSCTVRTRMESASSESPSYGDQKVQFDVFFIKRT